MLTLSIYQPIHWLIPILLFNFNPFSLRNRIRLKLSRGEIDSALERSFFLSVSELRISKLAKYRTGSECDATHLSLFAYKSANHFKNYLKCNLHVFLTLSALVLIMITDSLHVYVLSSHFFMFLKVFSYL